MRPGATTRPRASKFSSALPRNFPAAATSVTRPSLSRRSYFPSRFCEGSMRKPPRIERLCFSRESTRIHTNSFPAIFKDKPFELRLGAEIQEQTDLEICRAKVIKNLRVMGRINCFRCLEFNQDRTAYNQVSFVFSNRSASKPNWGGNLPLCRQACIIQGDRESLLVNCFQ